MEEAQVREAFSLLPESADLDMVFVDIRRKVIGLAYDQPRDRSRWEAVEKDLLQRLNRLIVPIQFEKIHWMLRHRAQRPSQQRDQGG